MKLGKPDWWSALAPAGRRLGIAWHRRRSWWPAENLGRGDEDPGTIVPPEHAELDARLRAGKVLVGSGPTAYSRVGDLEFPARWYLDPHGGLWCALAPYFPSWLWVPVEPTEYGLSEVLMGSFPRTVPLRTELPAAARGFLGHVTDIRVPQVYDGRPGQFGGHELDRYFGAMAYPMPNPWGSAQVDDPLQARIGTVPTLALVGAIRGNLAQRLGRVPSMTWRLQQSRAYLGIEVHCRDMVCAAVRYQSTPASHRRTVERLNGALGTSYPVDMPLDAIGALTGFRWQTEQTLARHLGADAPADQLAATVQVLAALRHDDLAATVRLREYARHPAPQVRRAVAAAALWYGNLFLATEVMLSEPDPAARAELGDLIAVGGYGPDTYNAFNDYFDDVPVLLDDADEPVGTWSDSDQNGDEA